MFKNRSVVEVMVMVFTFVVAFFIVGLGVLIIFVEIRSPESDTGVLANTLGTLVSGILGALLGLIAGKSSATNNLHERPNDKEEDDL